MTSHLRNIKICQNNISTKNQDFLLLFKDNRNLKECADTEKSHTGGVGVAGSNPVVPTNYSRLLFIFTHNFITKPPVVTSP